MKVLGFVFGESGFFLALLPLLPLTRVAGDALLCSVILSLVLCLASLIGFALKGFVLQEKVFAVYCLVLAVLLSFVKMGFLVFLPDYEYVLFYLGLAALLSVFCEEADSLSSGSCFWGMLWRLLGKSCALVGFLTGFACLRESLSSGTLSFQYLLQNETVGFVFSYEKFLFDLGLVGSDDWYEGFAIFYDAGGAFLLLAIVLVLLRLLGKYRSVKLNR